MGASPPRGEVLGVPERVIVAPGPGTFHRLSGGHRVREGDTVRRGDVIGVVRSLGVSTPVHSPFQGRILEVLACEGERVRPGQRLAWLRVA